MRYYQIEYLDENTLRRCVPESAKKGIISCGKLQINLPIPDVTKRFHRPDDKDITEATRDLRRRAIQESLFGENFDIIARYCMVWKVCLTLATSKLH